MNLTISVRRKFLTWRQMFACQSRCWQGVWFVRAHTAICCSFLSICLRPSMSVDPMARHHCQNVHRGICHRHYATRGNIIQIGLGWRTIDRYITELCGTSDIILADMYGSPYCWYIVVLFSQVISTCVHTWAKSGKWLHVESTGVSEI